MTAYADLVRADGALAYFPLDDASPAAVADASGHGYTGAGPVGPIQSGGAAPFSGSGGSMRFNGAEDISLAAGLGGSSLAALPHGGAPFSYEVWAQPIDNCLGGGNDGGGGLLFVRGTPGLIPNGTWCQWSFDDAPHGTLLVRNRTPGGGGGSGSAVQTPDLRGGGFHHLVVVYTGSAGVLYLDGAPLALELPDHAGDLALAFAATAASLGGEFSSITWSGNLAHAAFYPGALTPCQVLSHYDLATSGHYTPCLDWVRLIHAGGRGDWRTNGERIEERAAGKLSRVHDGTTSTVYSDEHAVLQTPLAVLDASPSVLVGRDPSTDLPAYCPPPAVTSSVPITPVVVPIDPVPGGDDPCQQARCGAALALQDKVVRDYDQWRQWINAAVGFAIGGLIASVLAELAAILAAAEVAAWILQIFRIVSPVIGLTTTTLLPRLIPGLDAPQVDFILKACYCPLVCEGGQIVLSEAQKRAVAAALLGNMSVWTSDLQRELIGEIAFYEPLQDWQAATLEAQPVNDCAGISCP